MEIYILMVKEQNLMSNKLLSKTNDLIFKSIFGDYKNKSILIDFLQSILDLPKEEYDKIELLDPLIRSAYSISNCIPKVRR